MTRHTEDSFLGNHFTKIMAFLFAFMIFGIIMQWYGTAQYIDRLRGLQEVCESMGGVFVHEKACLKAENLFSK